MSAPQNQTTVDPPRVVILAGPNGAGKSTSARFILQGPLNVNEFVNADTIAQGLSGFDPDRVGLAAGRIMLARLRDLADARASFAFETTLASRTFAPWIGELIETGYEFHLIFLWLPSADAAVARVADRVKRGGHNVPEATVRRRYSAGLKNLFSLYQPLATTWQVMDNSGKIANEVAAGKKGKAPEISQPSIWAQMVKIATA